MQKTGLKTFVYSFSVSLFAIFAANGMYWHDSNPVSSEIKIPNKNIMLFLKDEPQNPSNSFVPVKKIALSVLPDVQTQPSSGLDLDSEIILADELSLPEIPLEFGESLFEHQPPAEGSGLLVAENAAPKPKRTLQETKDISKPDKIVIPLQVPDAAGIERPSEAQHKDTSEIRVVKNDNLAADKTILQNDKNSSQSLGLPTLPASEPQDLMPKKDKELLIAEADNEPFFLPLEKNGNPASRAKNIVVKNSGAQNQVALVDKSVPIHSMESSFAKETSAAQEDKAPKWESMKEKKPTQESPWLVAKAEGALKNQRLSEEAFYKKEDLNINDVLAPQTIYYYFVKIASEIFINLLIPIPEDILNEENLTPQLSYPPEGAPKKTDQTAQLSAKETSPVEPQTPTEEKTEQGTAPQKNKILASLGAIFSPASQAEEESKKAASKEEQASALKQAREKKKSSPLGKIMPTEMRLSFQPNRAEISGQTLRWIQAFATKAAENNNMTIEIRIDGTSAMDLQQKRLNLLQNILTDKGVAFSKINTVFTQREPNSFIIKTITHNNIKGANRNLNKAADGYYLRW